MREMQVLCGEWSGGREVLVLPQPEGHHEAVPVRKCEDMGKSRPS